MSFFDTLDPNDPTTVDPTVAASQIGNLLSVLGGQVGTADPFANIQTPTPAAPAAPTPSTPTATAGGESKPFEGDAAVSQPFGAGNDHDQGGHPGIDFAVPSGTKILSMLPGTVSQVVGVNDSGGYGNEVVVDHGNGLTTRYAHLTNATVSVGQKVNAGEQLGLSGSTGQSTGPHLHFEVMENGAVVDPTPYLAGGGAIHSAEPQQTTAAPAPALPPPGSPPESAVALTQDMSAVDPFANIQKPEEAKPKTVGTTRQTGAAGATGDTDPGAVESFLAATRQHESGGDYGIYNQSGLSNASGAYQFIGTTWRGLGGSTQNAAEASPEEQDAIARRYAQQLFEQFGSWRLVAIAWYGGPGIAQQVANGQNPGAPDQQGSYLAYGDTIQRLMSGG